MSDVFIAFDDQKIGIGPRAVWVPAAERIGRPNWTTIEGARLSSPYRSASRFG